VGDEFEIAHGPGANESVNWTRPIYERVGEFGTLLLAWCGTCRFTAATWWSLVETESDGLAAKSTQLVAEKRVKAKRPRAPLPGHGRQLADRAVSQKIKRLPDQGSNLFL